mgnify:CR=1 FL=1
MRGFKDRCQTLETFAGTASRCGQRIINSVIAQHPEWELFSLDVSQAFAKGMTFEELARLTGEQLRHVEVDLDAEDVALIRTIPGYTDFNPRTETLQMLKAVYGLKDAPHAWRKRLHQVLEGFRLVPLIAEAELYVRHLSTGSPNGTGKPVATRLQELQDREEAAKEEQNSAPYIADPHRETHTHTDVSSTTPIIDSINHSVAVAAMPFTYGSSD